MNEPPWLTVFTQCSATKAIISALALIWLTEDSHYLMKRKYYELVTNKHIDGQNVQTPSSLLFGTLTLHHHSAKTTWSHQRKARETGPLESPRRTSIAWCMSTGIRVSDSLGSAKNVQEQYNGSICICSRNFNKHCTHLIKKCQPRTPEYVLDIYKLGSLTLTLHGCKLEYAEE
jgi:hypothetical protein